jgi:hypothetical protein
MTKDLRSILIEKRPAILKKWIEEIFATYPADSATFLKGEQDMFANPVGHTVTINAAYIVDGMIKGDSPRTLSDYLVQIIRIRAVQNFSLTGAVSFVANLKTLIMQQLETDINKYNLQAEWAELETSIDSLHDFACQIYTDMKGKIAAIRAKESDRRERFLNRLTECRTG